MARWKVEFSTLDGYSNDVVRNKEFEASDFEYDETAIHFFKTGEIAPVRAGQVPRLTKTTVFLLPFHRLISIFNADTQEPTSE